MPKKYIGECLASCLDQGFDPAQYEIICVNDGSTDGSRAVIKEYQESTGRIVLIDQENGGVSRARNMGIEVAQADYLWFVDADDFVQTNAVCVLYHICRQLRARGNVDAVSFTHYEFENALSEEECAKKRNHTLPATAAYGIYDSLFQRKFVNRHGLRFRPGMAYGEDGLFLFEFIYRSPVRVFVREVLYFYRRNETSATRTKTPAARLLRQESYYRHALVMLEYAKTEHDRTLHAGHEENNSMLMRVVRTITVLAAGLPKERQREILGELRKEGLFPLFLYRKIKDWFPKKNHMMHARMGFKGKVLDVLNFYSTTRIGFFLLAKANAIYYKNT